MDEINYEPYDIDEYMLMEGTTWMKIYFVKMKMKILTTWMMWMKIMNIAEFNPHGQQYMVGFVAVIMHD